jgi:hypothetical protein
VPGGEERRAGRAQQLRDAGAIAGLGQVVQRDLRLAAAGVPGRGGPAQPGHPRGVGDEPAQRVVLRDGCQRVPVSVAGARRDVDAATPRRAQQVPGRRYAERAEQIRVEAVEHGADPHHLDQAAVTAAEHLPLEQITDEVDRPAPLDERVQHRVRLRRGGKSLGDEPHRGGPPAGEPVDRRCVPLGLRPRHGGDHSRDVVPIECQRLPGKQLHVPA